MRPLDKRFARNMTAVFAAVLGTLLIATPTIASEDHWTVLTMAPDGSWGAATSLSTNRAIAGAIVNCKTMSQSEIGCGANFTAIRAGWSLGIRCGRENIIMAAKTLADAEQAAVNREIELRQLYVPDMSSCQRVVTVDPQGAIVVHFKAAAQQEPPAGADGLPVANVVGPPQTQQPQSAVAVPGDRAPWRDLSLHRQFPWSPKWIALGTYQDIDDIRDALDRALMKIGLSANAILSSPQFTFSAAQTEVTLVIASVADLGFGDEGASLAAIYARARALGLELCPAEAGPQLRLRYRNQPVGEWLHIAMIPIVTDEGTAADFTVANGGAGLLLLGGDAHPDRIMPAAIKFVFMLPRPARNIVAR